MKRTGNIYEKIADKENIRQAIVAASKGKKWRNAVKNVLSNIDFYVEKIHEILINKQYCPCKVKERDIFEGSRHKKRHITTIAFYPDQIIHWCVIRQIAPYLLKFSYVLSCGSVPDKGSIYASRFIKRWLRRDYKKTKYCAKLDIRHFYPSIKHDILLNLLKRKFKDKDLIDLLEKIIGHWQQSENRGLPIGFLTSQWFANFVLTPLDNFIKQKLKIVYYVRYMDDMILFSPNKRKLHKNVTAISEYLKHIGLELKDNWQVFKTDSRPIDFLGFRFYRTHTTLRKALMLRISRKAKRIIHRYSPDLAKAKSIMSYMGWIKHSNSYRFFKDRIERFICIGKARKIISKFDKEHTK